MNRYIINLDVGSLPNGIDRKTFTINKHIPKGEYVMQVARTFVRNAYQMKRPPGSSVNKLRFSKMDLTPFAITSADVPGRYLITEDMRTIIVLLPLETVDYTALITYLSFMNDIFDITSGYLFTLTGGLFGSTLNSALESMTLDSVNVDPIFSTYYNFRTGSGQDSILLNFSPTSYTQELAFDLVLNVSNAMITEVINSDENNRSISTLYKNIMYMENDSRYRNRFIWTERSYPISINVTGDSGATIQDLQLTIRNSPLPLTDSRNRITFIIINNTAHNQDVMSYSLARQGQVRHGNNSVKS